MDKTAEARKKILSNIRALSFGCFSHDNEFIDGVLDEYAQQVSREERKKLAMQVWHDSRINASIPEEKDRIIFDSYWQNKEESNG